MSRNLSTGCWWEDRPAALLATDSSRPSADLLRRSTFFLPRVGLVKPEAGNRLGRCLLLRLISTKASLASCCPRPLPASYFIGWRGVGIDIPFSPTVFASGAVLQPEELHCCLCRYASPPADHKRPRRQQQQHHNNQAPFGEGRHLPLGQQPEALPLSGNVIEYKIGMPFSGETRHG